MSSNQPQKFSPKERAGVIEYAMTTADVAAEMGVCMQRVSHLENSALKKLRRALEERGISLDDLLEA